MRNFVQIRGPSVLSCHTNLFNTTEFDASRVATAAGHLHGLCAMQSVGPTTVIA